MAASLSYGVSVVFRKIGIDHVADAVIAAAVTTTSSWGLLASYLIVYKTIRGVSAPVNTVVCGRGEFFVF